MSDGESEKYSTTSRYDNNATTKPFCYDVDKKKPYVKKPPIISYGLIVATRDRQTGKQLFLLYQRRDTFEYMDFIRGIWSSRKQLPILFSNMTKDEKSRLRQYTLKELWNDLWTNHSCHIYVDGWQKALIKYASIKEEIPDLLDNTENNFLEEPPWGFPKGKKNSKESDVDTALREFEEETLLSKTKVKIIDYQPFTEIFKGSNNKHYCTHYFFAEYPNAEIPPPTYTPQCIREKCISEEVGDIKWVSLDDAEKMLTPSRFQLLQKVSQKYENFKKT